MPAQGDYAKSTQKGPMPGDQTLPLFCLFCFCLFVCFVAVRHHKRANHCAIMLLVVIDHEPLHQTSHADSGKN